MWFGSTLSTINCAEIHALLWDMSKLDSLWVSGKILVLGDFYLVIGFSIWRVCLSKPELFRATNEIAAIWQWLDGMVMFYHMG